MEIPIVSDHGALAGLGDDDHPQYLLILPGDIIMRGVATARAGFLPCDGAAVSRTTYAALFAAIGETFGNGDGSTTFNVPNMENVFPVGADGTYNVGDRSVTASHGHNAKTATTNVGKNGIAVVTDVDVASSSHIPPYLALDFIIKT